MIELVTTQTILDYALLPIELTNGNDGRGSKWFKSSAVRKHIEDVLRATGHTRPQPHPPGVTLSIKRILGPSGAARARACRWEASKKEQGSNLAQALP